MLHRVERYGFQIELPSGFTKLVISEVPSRRMYDSYHGNYSDNSFVHVHIQGVDVLEERDGEFLKRQLDLAVKVCKEQGARVLKADFLHLSERDCLLIHLIHEGKECLMLQQYCQDTTYIVACAFDKKDKYGLKEFFRMLESAVCL